MILTNTRIWFHGTDETASLSIRQRGFRAGTYFARALEDALWFGGDHVFEVVFPDDLPPDVWQRRATEEISADRIVSHCKYTKEVLFDNKTLRGAIFDANEGAT